MKKEWNSPKMQELGLEKTAAEGQLYCYFHQFDTTGGAHDKNQYLSSCPAKYTAFSQCKHYTLSGEPLHCPECNYLG